MNPSTLYIGTSWKMNKTIREAIAYCQSFVGQFDTITGREHLQVFLVPPVTALAAVKEHTLGRCLVGAQNMHWDDSGAFTGEISAPMLIELGADLVELGHSERRVHFNETDASINRKVLSALKHRLRPLICVGETADEKRYGVALDVIARQIRIALNAADQEDAGRVWIAYEPVWAIGSGGSPAESGHVREAVAHIRSVLHEVIGASGSHVPVLYGGSVDPGNAAELLHHGGCDGLFVGRAAWESDGLVEIIRRCLAAAPLPPPSRSGALRIAIDCDDAGRALKPVLVEHLRSLAVDVTDLDLLGQRKVDYPDVGFNLATRIAKGEFDRGVLICGTGLGMAMIANKVEGVYAGVCHDVFSAERLKKSNDAQVITMGERVIGPELAKTILSAWLKSEFEGGRSAPKVSRMRELERGAFLPRASCAMRSPGH
jgi:L-erythrulose 1-phosphate isomerase